VWFAVWTVIPNNTPTEIDTETSKFFRARNRDMLGSQSRPSAVGAGDAEDESASPRKNFWAKFGQI